MYFSCNTTKVYCYMFFKAAQDAGILIFSLLLLKPSQFGLCSYTEPKFSITSNLDYISFLVSHEPQNLSTLSTASLFFVRSLDIDF